MTVLRKLQEVLDRQHVPYEVRTHPEVFTAQEIAAALHVPGRELAKVVMVKAGDRFVMAVLPASWRADPPRLRAVPNAPDARLATEAEFKGLFPDCDVGAMPPFGNLYGLEVYVDRSLTADETILFNAGTHYEAVRMQYEDFARMARPLIADFAVHLH